MIDINQIIAAAFIVVPVLLLAALCYPAYKDQKEYDEKKTIKVTSDEYSLVVYSKNDLGILADVLFTGEAEYSYPKVYKSTGKELADWEADRIINKGFEYNGVFYPVHRVHRVVVEKVRDIELEVEVPGNYEHD